MDDNASKKEKKPKVNRFKRLMHKLDKKLFGKPLYDLGDVIVPVYYVTKLIGLTPVSLRKIKHRKKLVTTRSNIIYFILFAAFYFSLSLYTVLTTREHGSDLESEYLGHLQSYIIMILVNTMVVCSFIFKKQVIKSLEDICEIDEKFNKAGVAIDYNSAYRSTCLQLVPIFLSVFARSYFFIANVRMDVVQQITIVATVFIKSFSKHQFLTIVLLLKNRYFRINDFLNSYYSKLATYKTNEQIDMLTGHLYVLCRIHYKLRHIVIAVNTSYAFQILVHLGVCLSDIIFQSYILYELLFSANATSSFVKLAYPVSWLVDEILEVYTLVAGCSGTCEAAADTAVILHQLQNNFKHSVLENHVHMYSLQMLHQQMQFSALGFVVIDYTLLYSIIGAVTTYLVIFVQFDQASVPSANATLVET